MSCEEGWAKPGWLHGCATWSEMTPHKRQRRRNPRAKDASFIVSPSRGLLTESYGPTCRIQRTLKFDQPTTAVDTGRNWNFSLSDVPNVSEFKNLFQQWKLDLVTIDLVWRPPTGVVGGGPRFVYTNDPFTQAGATLVDLMQRKSRVWAPNPTRNTLRILIRPRVTMLVTSTPLASVTTNYALAPANTWYSCDQDGTSYGTLVTFTEDYNDTVQSSGLIQHYHTYHFSFRGTR